MKKAIIAAILLLTPYAAQAFEPESFKLKYQADYSGLKVGEARITVEQTADSFTEMAQVDAAGILKAITNYWGVSKATGSIKNGKLIPGIFDVKFQPKKTVPQRIVVTYAADGKITEEATPPENHGKHPEVAQEDKKDSFDPITAGIFARSKIREIIETKQVLPQNFKIRTYDARRAFDLNLEVLGYENKEVDGKKGNYLKLILTRTPIAGFNKKELEKLKSEDPAFTIYVNDKYVPVYASAKTTMGSATISLTGSCFSSGCKL